MTAVTDLAAETNPAVGTGAAAETAQTNQHYDLDPRIFGLFLDPMRKYSSGYYRKPDLTLAESQVEKLHFVADRLGLRQGDRLLDVGCGWGSLILFMAEHYKARVVGISPAGNQHAYIAGRAAQLGVADRVQTVQGHFEQADLPDGPFDAVTMLGSIVHMPDLVHVMRRARSMLRRGGRYYVSESCFRNEATRETFDRTVGLEFVRNSIFGWGDMRPLSDLVRAAEDAGFSIVSVDDLTDDYRLTIDEWIRNVDANADAIEAISPGMSATLRRYLEVANAGWGYTTKHYALVCQKSR
jgi:cyclopropane-fatty-acyl-phospholipid synthase